MLSASPLAQAQLRCRRAASLSGSPGQTGKATMGAFTHSIGPWHAPVLQRPYPYAGRDPTCRFCLTGLLLRLASGFALWLDFGCIRQVALRHTSRHPGGLLLHLAFGLILRLSHRLTFLLAHGINPLLLVSSRSWAGAPARVHRRSTRPLSSSANAWVVTLLNLIFTAYLHMPQRPSAGGLIFPSTKRDHLSVVSACFRSCGPQLKS